MPNIEHLRSDGLDAFLQSRAIFFMEESPQSHCFGRPSAERRCCEGSSTTRGPGPA